MASLPVGLLQSRIQYFAPSIRNTAKRLILGDFPHGTVVKNLPANAKDTCLILGLGRSHMPWSN